jgi:hypothetical protein
MMWVDYNIDQAGENFKVSGDWPGEVMGLQKDGTPKDNWLYKPGDVFIVNESGWLMKSDHLSALVMKYEKEKNEM